MSSFSIFQIAGSALTAQSQRMNVSASNLANADSVVGPDGQPYKARQVVFQMTPQGNSPVGGVQVLGVQESNAPGRLQYDPGNPYADAQGYVTLPNVDVVAETVNMLAASRSYQANVEVVNTSKNLMLRTLTIGQ
ncbi:flagellar basal body rod protein FlgC [Alcaligenes ammonioxydans]|jgi:flagellar basal-body rod protein FlgC|uniref:Flagellar basal-body rod protein FlgC n=1 Tax=Alcaligenes ammonioxydans TaxID=2582914 RepID=A0ABX8SRG1_9BURK|nr:flagellar basal body rod protein FlgC [Alcaligenes ammonioxydans]EJC61514.1 flagellar basal body rod protein FlgC [Alcaligenes faecalis subsp. faecalis NCIB 8687]QBH20512.1 flagellar basal body rod protein FlgC [Alcaligenes faecalis]MCH1880566.1 flagellar basal body rod protein FlgC [Alcaligenes ammonioxydans]QXX78585.1 flagellar basal body rod protein FlgC [Alcaligenes ammonioxydans]WGQ36708.1 flagellar basal body rod protein FlgC [Alcaligenes faecalis]